MIRAQRTLLAFGRPGVRAMSSSTTFSPNGPDLRHTGALRLDRYALKKNSDGSLEYGNVLAMWVADMDFRAPPHIIEALKARSEHGVFGYPHITAKDENAVLDYLVQQHNLPRYDPSTLVFLPGLVVALNVCARAYAKSGEAIMMATPVYPPFFLSPRIQGRMDMRVPLVKSGSRWTMDLDAMRRMLNSGNGPAVKAFFLCNPHNPMGRVFEKNEIVELLKLCSERNIVVISDEIHCDLVLDDDARHTSALGLGYDDHVIALHAPSKTYNIAGVGAAVAVIPNPQLKSAFKKEARGIVADMSVFGYTAMRAAYADGRSNEWRKGLIEYLRGNRDYLSDQLKMRVPQVKFDGKMHQGTYLAWLDCTELMRSLDASAPGNFKSAASFFLETAQLAFNDGTQFFGDQSFGRDHVRLNFACHRDRIKEAVDRMESAVSKHAARL